MGWHKNECFRRDIPRCVVCEEDLARDDNCEGELACVSCRSRQCARSALDDGWFYWCGAWFHVYPWESGIERPPYIIGSARDVCLLQGLETGDTTL